MNITCPNCSSNQINVIDDYKPFTREDAKYFPNMKIIQCRDCKLGFASPVPSKSILNDFYTHIYRKSGRPHYIDNPESIKFDPWQNSQYNYISQFINIEKIKTILDIGPGYGFLLREFRRNNKNLRLIAADPDIRSLKYLEKYRIEIKKILFDLEEDKIDSIVTPDLILASHSLEHMSDPKSFFTKIKQILPLGGKLFIEVPNCPLTPDLYLQRCYDSPHLLFFNEDTLKHIIEDFNFRIINITTASFPYSVWIENSKNLFKLYSESKSEGSKVNELKKRMIGGVNSLLGRSTNYHKIENFYHYQYGGDRWVLRALLTKI